MNKRRLMTSATITVPACVSDAGLHTAHAQTPTQVAIKETDSDIKTNENTRLLYQIFGRPARPGISPLYGFSARFHMFRKLSPVLAARKYSMAPCNPGVWGCGAPESMQSESILTNDANLLGTMRYRPGVTRYDFCIRNCSPAAETDIRNDYIV